VARPAGRAQIAGRITDERRLVLVIAAVVFVDTMFYAAIAPLLPTLTHQLHLTKLSAGVMTAAYPVGTLVASLPGGVLAVRAGPKRTVFAGLALLAGSSLAFGLLRNTAALDAARFVEGVGGACSWAGGLAWLVAEAPAGRRGELIGGALGAAIGGALFGPVIGTIASGIGRAAAFSLVALAAVALIDRARRLPHHHAPSGQGVIHLFRAFRAADVRSGAWLMALPAIVSGTYNVLGPLRMHRLGVGAAVIGATFLFAAGLEAAVTPMVGRLSDRRGRLVPMRVGLLSAAALLACFTLPMTAWLLAVLIIAVAITLSGFWAPAMAMLSEAGEARGLDQALAAALMNLTWAGGQIVGSGVGGAVAKGAGDAVPTGVAAGLCAVTLLVLTGPGPTAPRWSTRRRSRPGARSGGA
jgi:MFS family permease